MNLSSEDNVKVSNWGINSLQEDLVEGELGFVMAVNNWNVLVRNGMLGFSEGIGGGDFAKFAAESVENVLKCPNIDRSNIQPITVPKTNNAEGDAKALAEKIKGKIWVKNSNSDTLKVGEHIQSIGEITVTEKSAEVVRRVERSLVL